MWNLKNKTNIYRNIETDSLGIENKLVVISRKREWGRARWGYGIKRYKLLCIKG